MKISAICKAGNKLYFVEDYKHENDTSAYCITDKGKIYIVPSIKTEH